MFSIARLEVRTYRKECKRKSWLVIDEELAEKITETMIDTGEAQPMDDLRIALGRCISQPPFPRPPVRANGSFSPPQKAKS